ncbi:unnamed protein product [Ilex paraguariensis]|uniref:Uncharacterized protein n=1 Tax=Ilex paraguariensis TaxID=185542 RepID=A0ABC8RSR7_9AQUA
MEETLVSTPPRFHSLSSPFSSSTEVSEPDYTKPSPKSSAAKAPPPSVTRLWRPAAQRNLRNQWSNLASYRQKWNSSSSIARSHVTSLVNAFLSQRYMNARELGVLSDMPDIRKKACCKLFKQQELLQRKLLSFYKDLVAVVTHMIDSSRSMRCFLKGTSSSPLVQFSNCSREENDTGDGGGIVVFTFWSISFFEELAQELVQMFTLELNLKMNFILGSLMICVYATCIQKTFVSQFFQG